jgi:hypothetical protein
MSEEMERFAGDLAADEQLYREVSGFDGSFRELAGWLAGRGYSIDAGELAAVLSASVEKLDDEALDAVAGGGGLDGMNEMSEMTSLRLQMTMDRRSKFISTLSNIMKKISSTQDTLVQNIK